MSVLVVRWSPVLLLLLCTRVGSSVSLSRGAMIPIRVSVARVLSVVARARVAYLVQRRLRLVA